MEIGVKDPNAPLTKKEKAEKEAKSNGSLKSFFSVTPTKKVKEKKEEEDADAEAVSKTAPSSGRKTAEKSPGAKAAKLEKREAEAVSA